MMWKVYKYLFYQTYVWQKKMWGNSGPEEWAMAGMSFTFYGYFYSLSMLITIFGFDAVLNVFTDKIMGSVFGIIVVLFHYFIFLYRDRYKKIVSEFQTDDIKERKKGMIIFWVYVFGSMVSYLIAGILLACSVKAGFTVTGYLHSLFS